jgi:hypothetical protein
MRLRNGLAIALLVLAGCSASDHSGPPAPQGAAASKVFVADAANLAIGSLIDPNPAPGIVTLDRIVAGPDTGLGTPGGTPSVSRIPSIALDAAGDRLYVATQSSALAFDRIGTASGNVPRSRAIQSSVNNHAVNFFGLHIAAGDVLYAVEPTGEVHAFNNASMLDGTVAPDRTITPNVVAPITSSFGVTVDAANNALYVGVASPLSSILVFNNAATANAALTPDRTLNFALAVGSFCLDDDRDILYASMEDGVILVFDRASTLGMGAPVTPVPDRLMTLPVPTTTSPSKQLYVSVDTVNNRLYAVNGTTVFIINGASIADDAMLGATQIALSTASSLLSAVAVAP